MLAGTNQKSADSLRLLTRLLLLSWHYRRECLTVFAYQPALLALGISGLGLSGVAIDVTRAALSPSAPGPHWPLGILPPSAWSPRQVLLGIGSPILLLDDPTTAVDPETEHKVLEAMSSATAGRTTIVVANRLATLRRADSIVVLAEGVIWS